LTCTVTSGVDFEASHTIGTETIVGPRQAACLHHLFAKLLIRLLLLGAIGGFAGRRVFHALVERYHRPLTHIRCGRLLLWLTFGHGAAATASESLLLRWVDSARPAARAPTRRGAAQPIAKAHLIARGGHFFVEPEKDPSFRMSTS
jgi:hypothetical protein